MFARLPVFLKMAILDTMVLFWICVVGDFCGQLKAETSLSAYLCVRVRVVTLLTLLNQFVVI